MRFVIEGSVGGMYKEQAICMFQLLNGRTDRMNRITRLTTIGVVSGFVLASFLMIIHILTGNQAYILLFNVDYIPVLKDIWSQPGIGIVFHFVFCVISVVALFYVLCLWHLEKRWFMYVLVYVFGSGGLFFLTALSNLAPDAGDFGSWLYWTSAHLVYGIIVGLLIKNWVD